MMAAMLVRYAQAVQAVLQGSALPYGYTVTVWSSGAVVMSTHGPPKVGYVFLFAAGAIAGFALIASVGRAAPGPPVQPNASTLLITGVTHAVAAGAAIGAAALLGLIGGAAAWPLASFAATSLYLALAGLELLFARRQAD